MAQVLKDQVKNKIKKSAIEVFKDKGFRKASIKEIADLANVSVGNVYTYYPNKAALYEAVIKGVYDGVNHILQEVQSSENYKQILSGEAFNEKAIEPMIYFIKLYRKERVVFEMLIHNGHDEHYEQTVKLFIDLLKDYFISFWGSDQGEIGISKVEASAFANALVFSVIDLLNHLEEEALEETLMAFVNRMVKGYFAERRKEGMSI